MEEIPHSRQPVASRAHTLGLLAIFAVWTWLGTGEATRARAHTGNTLILLYAVSVIWEWLIVAYVAVGVRRYGGSLRQLIGGKWDRPGDFFRDVGVAFGFWIVSLPCLLAVRLALGGKPSLNAVRFLAPQSHVEIFLWILVALTAGICEEILFRGYLQRQFIAMTGNPALGILLSAVIFGGAHVYQGAKQAILLGVYGAMFGALAYRQRSLRPGMMAHAWQDTVAGLALRFLPK